MNLINVFFFQDQEKLQKRMKEQRELVTQSIHKLD